jgi:hypothetical protein
MSILLLTIPVSLTDILCYNNKIMQEINFWAQKVTLVRLNETNEVGAFLSFYMNMDVDTALTGISSRPTKYTTYIYISTIFCIMEVLLHVSMNPHHLQGVLFFYVAKVTKIIRIIKLNKFIINNKHLIY